MAQEQNSTTQNSIVLTPTAKASYGNGWRQMKKYFLELFLIGVIGILIGVPSGIGGETQDTVTVWGILGFAYVILILVPTDFGVSFAYLKAARNEKVKIGDMFEGFRNYWNALLAGLLVSVIVGIGFFLLIIPGIIFACKLAFTPFLVVDRKMAVIDAVIESWNMTNGHAWTVFLIGLLAIPITIGGLILLIVGIIPATMWISTASASLYHAVSTSSS